MSQRPSGYERKELGSIKHRPGSQMCSWRIFRTLDRRCIWEPAAGDGQMLRELVKHCRDVHGSDTETGVARHAKGRGWREAFCELSRAQVVRGSNPRRECSRRRGYRLFHCYFNDGAPHPPTGDGSTAPPTGLACAQAARITCGALSGNLPRY
jgi:hypothetical protein